MKSGVMLDSDFGFWITLQFIVILSASSNTSTSMQEIAREQVEGKL